MKRAILIGLLILVTAASGGLAWFLNSEAGLRWTLDQAQERIPGTLAIDHAEGRLAGPILIQGLRLETGGVRAAADRILIEWYPWELFSRRLHISALEVDALELELEAPRSGETGDAQQPGAIPLDLHLERLDLRGARIETPAGPPVELDSIRAEAIDVSRGVAAIETLRVAVASPVELIVETSARLPLAGRGPVDARIRFDGRVEGHRISGDLAAGGSTADLTVEGTLAEPLGLRLNGRADAEADEPEWRLSVLLDAFRLDTLVPGARPLAITGGRIEAEGRGARLHGRAETGMRDPEFGHWRASATANLEGETWSVPRVLIEDAAGGARITARAAPEDGGGFVAEARWEGLAWPPRGDAAVASPSGNLRVAGNPERYTLRLEGAVEPAELPPVTVTIAGDGDREHLRLATLEADWLEGNWSGSGEVAWAPLPRWDLTVEAEGVRPGTLYTGLDGEVSGRIVSAGSIPEAGLTLAARIEALRGELLGRPVAGRASVRMAPEGIELEGIDLASGDSRVSGHARIGEIWDAAWRIASPDLSRLVPGLSGALHGNGTITGPPEALSAAIELNGEGLAMDRHRIGTLAVDAGIDLGAAGRWRGTAVADAVRAAGIDLGRISIETDGTSQAHALLLRIEHPEHAFAQRARGSLDGPVWRGVLHEGRASHDLIGTWTQRGEASVSVSRDGSAHLEAWCLESGPSVACADGARTDAGAIEAALDWEALDLGLLTALLPQERLSIAGTLDGGAAVTVDESGRPIGRIEAEARDGALRFGTPDEADAQEMRFQRIAIGAAANADGASGDFALLLPDAGHLTATTNLPGLDLLAPRLETQPLEGTIEARIEDFSALTLFVPAIHVGEASAEAGVMLGGTLLAPRIEGDARLTVSTLSVPRIGTEIADLEARARMTGDRLTLEAGGRMGDGTFQVSGGASIENDRWEASLGVNGDDLEVLRLPALQLVASPRVSITATPGELVFNGTVTIPEAAIEPILPETAITASSDVIVIGREAPQAGSPVRIRGRLEVVLGDAVTVEGRGFEGRLDGRLLLLVPRQDTITAQGEIQFVDGRYRAYGQNLVIRQGRVLYAGGPIDNPAIDVIASRTRGERNEIEVGVRVTGTALSPFVELYSEPAMDEADILSYIIIGRPIDEAGEGEGVDLYQAAASVAIAGGGALAERIGERFDLVEVSIESGEESDDTAIVLGRSLSSRLYVRYVHGILDDTSAVQLRYDLDENWALETETGTRSGAGADITFTVDR